MHLDKEILRIIEKYIDRKENIVERKRLYQWYERFSVENLMGKKTAAELQRRNRARLAREIDGLSVNAPRIISIWPRIAAAAAILLGMYFIFRLGMREPLPIELKNAALDQIMPVSEKVLITLSDGRKFNPDTLKPGSSAKIGNITVQKQATGELIYNAESDKGDERIMSQVTTPRGKQFRIRLPDGSMAVLNAKSRLSFPGRFSSGDRVVELNGEAYFEVRKLPTHGRFIVQTNRQSIEVLGTKFNVNAYENVPVIKTTLAEGSVRVQAKNKHFRQLLLRPDQQAVLTGDRLTSIPIDAKQVIAWTDGYFVFDGKNTEEVIREIAEWYGLGVDMGKGVKSVRYAGKIPKNISMGRLINLLSYAEINVKATKNQNGKIQLIVN